MRNKIIIKIIAFTMSIVLSLLFLSRVYNKKELKKFNNIPKKIKIANLGSSHGQFSFLYEGELEKEAFNFGLPSQPFYYDYKFLERYKNRFQKDSIVVIPITIFSFYQGNNLEKYNERYSKYFSYKELYKVGFSEYFLSRYFGILTGEDRFFWSVYNKIKYFSKEESGVSSKANIKNVQLTVNMHLNHSENPEVDREYLKQILNFCKENNLKAILVRTPVTYAYNNILTRNIEEERINNHLKIVFDSLDFKVKYLDYSKDIRISNNLEYFYDADHLNSTGARKFTNIFLQDIDFEGIVGEKE
ncbi:MAG: hypothetical protein ACRCY7_11405 [Cetobacterium sp.]|uniref:hypothetical protein n=1 Tax=Cetobacterium sp. TaxID=2071632 RepID=UPI003F3C3414